MSGTGNGTTSLLSYQRGPYLALSNLLPTHRLHSLATNPHQTLLYVTRVAILSYQPCLRLFLRTCINKLCNGTIPIHIQSISHSTLPPIEEQFFLRSLTTVLDATCLSHHNLIVFGNNLRGHQQDSLSSDTNDVGDAEALYPMYPVLEAI
jgi:hypothetical protein